MAGDEHQVARVDALCAPGQVVLGLPGLALVPDAEEGAVEVVARELEVVGVAAEEGDPLLGREDQAHVGEALVAVQVVLRAAVQGHDLAVEPAARLGRGLDGGDGLAPRGVGLGRGEPLGRARDRAADVLDGPQDEQRQVRAGQLLRARGGVEPVAQQVALGGRELLDPIAPHVVVGQHQAVGRDHRPRAAGEAHAGLLHVLQPLGARNEVELLLQTLQRGAVEEPHPLVGSGRRSGGGECDEQGRERCAEHGRSGVRGFGRAAEEGSRCRCGPPPPGALPAGRGNGGARATPRARPPGRVTPPGAARATRARPPPPRDCRAR